jgi:hypothetical protein
MPYAPALNLPLDHAEAAFIEVLSGCEEGRERQKTDGCNQAPNPASPSVVPRQTTEY